MPDLGTLNTHQPSRQPGCQNLVRKSKKKSQVVEYGNFQCGKKYHLDSQCLLRPERAIFHDPSGTWSPVREFVRLVQL